MILDCPLCRTRYLVPATIFAAGPRQVRCARCKHGWKAELPSTIEVVAPPEPLPPPAKITPIPPGSNLPVLTKKSTAEYFSEARQGVAIVLLVLLLVGLILNRGVTTDKWPLVQHLYDAAGLSPEAAGEGLEFDQVRSELKYDDGITKLILNGKIKNKTQKNQIVPPIVAQAMGPDGLIIQSWQIDPPAAKLAPEEEASFTSAINAPKGTVVNVIMNFAENKNGN